MIKRATGIVWLIVLPVLRIRMAKCRYRRGCPGGSRNYYVRVVVSHGSGRGREFVASKEQTIGGLANYVRRGQLLAVVWNTPERTLWDCRIAVSCTFDRAGPGAPPTNHPNDPVHPHVIGIFILYW